MESRATEFAGTDQVIASLKSAMFSRLLRARKHAYVCVRGNNNIRMKILAKLHGAQKSAGPSRVV